MGEIFDGLAPWSQPTFGSLSEWYVLGGRCVKCGHRGWIDRRALQRLYGKDKHIAELRPFLRCRPCKNKGDNEWIMGKLPR